MEGGKAGIVGMHQSCIPTNKNLLMTFNRVFQYPYFLDLNLDHIALGERTDPFGRAGDDKISLYQSEVFRDESYGLANGKDHQTGICLLYNLAIQPRLNFEILRISDVLVGNDHGSNGTEGVERFAAEPA